MRPTMRLAAILALLACDIARGQDVPGIELCTHETRMERRTGCLQSNIEYLHALIAKNAAATQQKANAAASEIAALKAEVAALRMALTALQARLDRLEAAARKRPSAVPEAPEKPAAKR